jgi:hypothetical protein
MSKGFMRWAGIIMILFNLIAIRGMIENPSVFYTKALPSMFTLIVAGTLLQRSRADR